MTTKRLEELKKKFADKTGDINDIGELLCDLFQSSSNHFKDLKGQIAEMKVNEEVIYDDVQEIKNLMNPIYTIIHHDDEDEAEYEDENYEESSLDTNLPS